MWLFVVSAVCNASGLPVWLHVHPGRLRPIPRPSRSECTSANTHTFSLCFMQASMQSDCELNTCCLNCNNTGRAKCTRCRAIAVCKAAPDLVGASKSASAASACLRLCADAALSFLAAGFVSTVIHPILSLSLSLGFFHTRDLNLFRSHCARDMACSPTLHAEAGQLNMPRSSRNHRPANPLSLLHSPIHDWCFVLPDMIAASLLFKGKRQVSRLPPLQVVLYFFSSPHPLTASAAPCFVLVTELMSFMLAQQPAFPPSLSLFYFLQCFLPLQQPWCCIVVSSCLFFGLCGSRRFYSFVCSLFFFFSSSSSFVWAPFVCQLVLNDVPC